MTGPQTVIKPDRTYSATLSTSMGDITVSLNTTDTPITANNFIYLAQQGFYDKTIFHRVIEGFMIQGGDPKGDGTGGPGYRFADEPITENYTRGTIAMANSGPNTNGSQFFIMHQDYPLPKNYVIFGHVTAGLDIVDRIAQTPVQPNASGELSSPVTQVQLSKVVVSEQ
jgi:cyclophilin family peptidyl-prolyl cis-trans isomerase